MSVDESEAGIRMAMHRQRTLRDHALPQRVDQLEYAVEKLAGLYLDARRRIEVLEQEKEDER